MAKNLNEIIRLIVAVATFHIFVAATLYPWASDKDFTNLPPKTQSLDRFLTLFYYSSGGFTSSGTAVSRNAKIYLIVWALIVTAGIYELNQELIYN